MPAALVHVAARVAHRPLARLEVELPLALVALLALGVVRQLAHAVPLALLPLPVVHQRAVGATEDTAPVPQPRLDLALVLGAVLPLVRALAFERVAREVARVLHLLRLPRVLASPRHHRPLELARIPVAREKVERPVAVVRRVRFARRRLALRLEGVHDSVEERRLDRLRARRVNLQQLILKGRRAGVGPIGGQQGRLFNPADISTRDDRT
jgi:hypothetical protein